MQSLMEVDEEDLYTLKINCKGKRTIGKANKGINVEKITIGLKKLKIKIKKGKREKRKEKEKKKKKRGKLHRTAKALHRSRGL